MRAVAVIVVLALTACTPFGATAPLVDGGVSDASESDAANDASACAPACAAARCASGACVPFESCKALRAAVPELGDGIYAIDPDGTGPRAPLDVYCDMTTDGGGWTLVGRSVDEGASDRFGWMRATGSPSDDAQPYSLDVQAAGLAFTQLLFGARANGKAWDAPLYRQDVPAGFVAAYANGAYLPPQRAIALAGTCKQGRGMISYVGFTGAEDHFPFRDNDDGPGYGLFPGGWNTNGGTSTPGACDYNAGMNNLQGMIFVR